MRFDAKVAVDGLQAGITEVCTDSRRINDIGGAALFLAYPGDVDDGRRHIADAVKKGAAAVLWEKEGFDISSAEHIVNAPVSGLRGRVGAIADYVYRRPSARLFVAAITGTNGKTTTAWFAARLLNNAAVIGTLGAGVPGKTMTKTTTTTPDTAEIHRLLKGFADDGMAAVVMEASSHGIGQGRLANVRLDCAALVNLGRDHLDYHGDLRAYWRAKAKLFDMPGIKHAVINGGDKNSAALIGDLPMNVLTFCRDDKPVYVDNPTLLWRANEKGDKGGGELMVEGEKFSFCSPDIAAGCNIDNMLAAFLIARSAGRSWADIIAAAECLQLPPGRMQRVDDTNMYVDYAHTPDALAAALGMIRGGQKIVVFGCGGGRDKGKREEMGKVAAQLADVAVITDDNPRDEEAQKIRDAIAAGFCQQIKNEGDFCRLRVIADREKAIAAAVGEMANDDAVLVAGKGHEEYQHIGKRRVPFSDISVARRELDNKRRRRGTMMTSSFVAVVCDGAECGGSARFDGVAIDTRKLQKGGMFVALRGENADGHNFVNDAKNRGAAAAMVECKTEVDIPQVIVKDCPNALAALARQWRRYECGFGGDVVVITGSNGKTTAKEMLAAILVEAAGAKFVHRSEGNKNNLLGLPLSLLQLRKHHKYAVLEAGMDAPGELTQLGNIALPDVAVITNAQRAHLGGFESVAAIARAKGEILLSAQTGVLNADSPFFDEWKKQCRECVSFGFGENAQVRGRARAGGVVIDGIGFIPLAVAGEHNALNALAAAAAARVLAIDDKAIAGGLQKFIGVAGRLQFRKSVCGALVIDDTYNANPDSMLAALAVLAKQPGRRIAVLGDMLELGKAAIAEHQNIKAALPKGALLMTIGEMMKNAGGEHFDDKEKLARALKRELKNCGGDAAVLIKGSRGMKMETIAEAIVGR